MITKFKIFESLIGNLLEDKTWQDYRQYLIDSKSADGIQMDDELGEMIFASDPTPNKIYRTWLVEQFKKLKHSEFVNNLPAYTEALEIYDSSYKRIPKEFEEYKQISKIKDLETLRQIVSFIIERGYNVSKRALAKQRSEQSKVEIHSDYIQLHEDEEWRIVIPLTHAQSRYFAYNSGGDTENAAQWCTAATSTDSHFKAYSSVGPLYIFYNKLDIDRPSSKRLSHQLFINNVEGSYGHRIEFKDYKNNEVSLERFFDKYKDRKFPLSIIEFWRNPSHKEYLKGSLENFINSYLSNQVTNTSLTNPYTPVANMISSSGLIESGEIKISKENQDKLIFNDLNSLNFANIKKYFDQNPQSINASFSKNGQMTPMIICIKSQSDLIPFEKRDELTMRICKYLISKGADGSGTDEDGNSNIVIESIKSKKYKTLLSIIDTLEYTVVEGKNSPPIAYSLADPSVVSEKGDIPGTISVNEFEILIKKLVESGLDLNATDAKHDKKAKLTGLTVLCLRLFGDILRRGDKNLIESTLQILKVFLKYGADPCNSDAGKGESLSSKFSFEEFRDHEIYSIWNKATEKCK